MLFLTSLHCASVPLISFYILSHVQGAQEAKTNVLALDAHEAAVAVGHLAVAGAIEAAATAEEAGVVEGGVVWVGLPHPLTHVAAHVVESVSICHLLSNRMCYIVVVVVSVPAHIVQAVASRVFVVFASPCGFFPFVVCREPVAVCAKVAVHIGIYSLLLVGCVAPVFRVCLSVYGICGGKAFFYA